MSVNSSLKAEKVQTGTFRKPNAKASTTPVPQTYRRPQNNIFPYLPDALVPYAELMRLDRPAGFWAFWWHYLIGLSLALHLPSTSESPMSILHPPPESLAATTIARWTAYLYVWTTLFRGLTCTWNDALDQDVDRKVARTKFRPIARRAVSTGNALLFVLLQAIACGAILLPVDPRARPHALFSTVLLFIYPVLKRITDFPQIELGIGVSWPIFFVSALLGRDPWYAAPRQCVPGYRIYFSVLSYTDPFRAAVAMYFACVLWTVIFDTIYAHQDYEDDLKAGVRGLAVRLGRDGTKPALGALGCVQVSLLIAAGMCAHLGATYYVVACGGAAMSLATMLLRVRLESVESCAFWFGPGSRAVGACIVAGLMGEYFVREFLRSQTSLL